MNTIHLIIIENIIINIARKKYDEKIKCECEQKFHRTIIISLDEIKQTILENDWIDFTYNDIEYIFYENDMNKFVCNMCGFFIYKSNRNIPIIKNLRKRIKYEFFSRYYIKAKKVRIAQSDSGVLLIVFELK
jgi:hypothetical protein